MNCEWKIFSGSQGGQKLASRSQFWNFERPQGTRNYKGFEKPIFCPAWTWENFSWNLVSVWAHPKGKILRTDCFISFFWVFVCNSSKIKIYFATIKLWMPPVSRSSPENSRPEACYFPIIRIMDAPSFQEFPRPAIFQ